MFSAAYTRVAGLVRILLHLSPQYRSAEKECRCMLLPGRMALTFNPSIQETGKWMDFVSSRPARASGDLSTTEQMHTVRLFLPGSGDRDLDVYACTARCPPSHLLSPTYLL